MATSLSKATGFTRKALIVFGILAIISIFFQIIGSGGNIGPTPSVPFGVAPTGFKFADYALGKLPHAQLSSFTLAPNTKAKYALDGKLPSFPNITNAYTLKKPRERLGNADRARKVAAILGFSNIETRTEGNVLIWEVVNRTRTLTYDKVLDKWNLKLAEKDPAFAAKKGINQDPGYYDSAKLINLITASLQINNRYFSKAAIQNYYINILGPEVYQSVTGSDQASYIKSSVFKSLESASFLVVTNNDFTGINSEVRKPDYLNGVANVIVQGNLEKPQEDILDFNYHEFEYDKVGVYPSLTVEEAYNNIQANKGVLYWLHLKDQSVFTAYQELNIMEFRINVAKTRIVYIEANEWLDEEEWTHYLEPYYLFEGTALVADGSEAEFAFLTEAIRPTEYK